MGPDGFARVLSPGENGLNFIQCADDGCATKSTSSFPYDGYSGYATGISLAVAADGVPSMEIGSWIGDTQSVDYIRCTNADCSGYSDQTVPGTWGNPYESSLVLGTDGATRMIAQASDGTVNHVKERVPKYFGPTGADPTDGGCGTGAGGEFFTVHYTVLDQDGSPMAASGITPQEHVTRNGQPQPGWHNFSTPETTFSDGKFDDDPVGTCFGPPKPTTNLCVSVNQSFQALYRKNTYPIDTTVSRQDCNNGISVTVDDNPSAYNNTFTQGTTQ